MTKDSTDLRREYGSGQRHGYWQKGHAFANETACLSTINRVSMVSARCTVLEQNAIECISRSLADLCLTWKRSLAAQLLREFLAICVVDCSQPDALSRGF